MMAGCYKIESFFFRYTLLNPCVDLHIGFLPPERARAYASFKASFDSLISIFFY
jgi:hypothetical protein